MLISNDDDRLLLIPGPTPVHTRIRAAISRPTMAHTSPDLAREFSDALSVLQRLVSNPEGKFFVFSGSGTLAQETALLNFVEPSDRLLVLVNGYFGNRLVEIGECHGLNVSVEKAEAGSSVTPGTLARRLEGENATVVALTHVETATGTMAPLRELATVAREHGAIILVDGVAALGATPEPMDAWGIDVLLAGGQKALGIPPGLSIIAASRRAWEKRLARTAPIHGYYTDLVRWLPSMENPQMYFSTHAVNMIYAFAEAMRIVDAEGFEPRFERHKQLASDFRSGLLTLGFESLTQPNYWAPTLSFMRVPRGNHSSSFRDMLRSHGVIAAGGLSDPDDRAVRFGHMGNITQAEVAIALDAIQRSIV